MRKTLLFAFCVMAFSSLSAQVIFRVESPANLVGSKNFTYSDPGAWGSPDMLDPANAVRNTLVFVDNNAPDDSLGCAALTNGASLAGKIAVIYRGSCEFGAKALNAQNAGAIAAVIINNVPGSPIAMGAGAVGNTVTIPVAMISFDDGAALKAEIKAGNVTAFFGNKRGSFAVDLGIVPLYTQVTPSSARPNAITMNANDFQISTGTFVYNFGNTSQPGVALKAEVTKNGQVLYTQSSTPSELAVEDSVLVTFPAFSQANYSNGEYQLKYSVLSTNADQSTEDNTNQSTILINDEVFAYSKIETGSNKPLSTSRARPGAFDTDYAACIAFRDKNASRLNAKGVYFSAFADAGVSIQDERFVIDLMEWNDTYTDINEATFENVQVIGTSEYFFDSDAQGQITYVPFDQEIPLVDNQKYLVCVTTDNARMLIGFDGSTEYDKIVTESQFPVGPIRSGATWFVGGFGTDLTAAIGLVTRNLVGINDVTANTTAKPFPMPASEFINIPLKSKLTGKVTIDVLDLSGRKLSSKTSELNPVGDLQVKTADLASGMYNFVLTFEDQSKQSIKVQINK